MLSRDAKRRLYAAALAQNVVPNDYVSLMKPFFLYVFKKTPAGEFNSEKFAALINSNYGWGINTIVVDSLLPTFVEWKWLEKLHDSSGNVSFHKRTNPVENPLQEKKIETIWKNLTIIAKNVRNYVQLNIKPIVTFEYSDDEIINHIFDFLTRVESDNLDKIVSFAKDRFKLRDNDGLEKYLDEKPLNYAFAKYVIHLNRKKDSKTLSFLSQITSVALVSSVVSDLRAPLGVPSNSKPVNLILDAPLFMNAIGVSGRKAQKEIQDLLDHARSHKWNICVYSHSCDETKYIIKQILDARPSDRYGPTGAAIRRGEISEATLKGYVGMLQQIAPQHGIQVILTGKDLTHSQHKYFNEDLYDQFSTQAPWHRESNFKARDHDALSVATIMRRRQGTTANTVFECLHLMVTHNPTFARWSRDFCINEGLLAPQSFPPIIYSRKIMGLLWLLGDESTVDVPKRQLLAACEHAVNPSTGFLSKLEDELSGIQGETADKILDMMDIGACYLAYSDKVLGNPAHAKVENLDILAKEIRMEAANDYRAEYENKQMTIQNKVKRVEYENETLNKKIRSGEESRASVERERKNLNKEKNRLKEEKLTLEKQAVSDAENLTKLRELINVAEQQRTLDGINKVKSELSKIRVKHRNVNFLISGISALFLIFGTISQVMKISKSGPVPIWFPDFITQIHWVWLNVSLAFILAFFLLVVIYRTCIGTRKIFQDKYTKMGRKKLEKRLTEDGLERLWDEHADNVNWVDYQLGKLKKD